MGMNILFIEDNLTDVEYIKEAFNNVEATTLIHSVATRREALELLSGEDDGISITSPDLLLLDLTLPEDNGFTVLESVREKPEHTGLPVIILTNSDDEEDILRSYELHANAFLRKPSDPSEYEALAEQIVKFWVNHNHTPPE
ncbi:response regulator (plasmid) [Halorarum halophilum]|uniref:Response regulator n=1 Tax=Halorarum halophilum TaxID=2743090 RepID=A0A7D5KPU2_9EURY|nr:response regulator [Halobaculum halophilum]QLG29842.1 response regulator [Halobaculum halophilum]